MSPLPFPSFDWTQGVGDEAQTLDYLRQSDYPLGAIQMPQQQSPNQFGLNGAGLDAASLAILQSMQGMPSPRNFGQGLVQGLAGGYAGARARGAQTRQAANEKATADAEALAKERRQAASEFGRGLAQHRYAMALEQMRLKGQSPPASARRIPVTPEIRAYARQNQIAIPPGQADVPESALYRDLPQPPKPGPAIEDFASDIETDTRGRKYINLGKYSPEQKKYATQAAKAFGAVALSPPEADAITQTDNAKLNIQDLRTAIDGQLPEDAATRAKAIVGIRLSQIFQTNESRAAWGAYRLAAIQALRAAAGSKGLRINQAEIAASVANDIPQLADTYPTAMKRLERLEKMLDNASDAVLVRDRSKMLTPKAPVEDIDAKLRRILQ